MLKNKTTLIAVAVVAVIALLAGGYLLFFNKPAVQNSKMQTQDTDTGPVTLSPEEIGLELKATPDNKKVQFTIEEVDGITAIEYELTYDADATAQERAEGAEDRIPRAVLGEAEIKSGQKTYQSPWLDLGSCSKNVCKYDTGIESINLILKITKDSKSYSVEQTLEL
jgi:hypothetical protein